MIRVMHKHMSNYYYKDIYGNTNFIQMKMNTVQNDLFPCNLAKANRF